MAERLNEFSATEIVRRIGRGEITAEAVVRDCLVRIEAREGQVQAWAFLDPELALAQARALDRAGVKGALHGVPIGIKDIIDTRDMPTDMGSPVHRGRLSGSDASCVALVRAAGAIILGKTVTCEFAGVTPGATTHPANAAHTPGGSSSGSAAAVADFMVPAAFGTQTGGSVLRPASFCGLVGYKPSYGLIARGGIKFAAESFDTIGLMTRSIDDADLLASVLMARPLMDRPLMDRPLMDQPLSGGVYAAPRIGLCRTYIWEKAGAKSAHAVEESARWLAAAGASVREIELPESFSALTEARAAINAYERARAMADEWNGPHRDLISARLTRTIEDGLALPQEKYLAALRVLAECRRQLRGVFDGFDVLLAPCVNGEAPKGLDYTGDPSFQEIWTMLHVPTMTLPSHAGPNGLPVGIQLVGQIYQDDSLFAAARWIGERLASKILSPVAAR